MLNANSLTILDTETDSGATDLGSLGSRRNLVIGIIAPAALTGTVTVRVSTALAGVYGVYQDPPGTDFAVAAGKAILLHDCPFRFLKLVSSGAEAADRVFQITANLKG